MKRAKIIGIACCLLAFAVTALADSFISVPNTGERLYRWDGAYMMKPNTGERLFKYDGTYVTKPNTGERLTEIKGNVPVGVLLALATGLL